jgi:hypothetical protein
MSQEAKQLDPGRCVFLLIDAAHNTEAAENHPAYKELSKIDPRAQVIHVKDGDATTISLDNLLWSVGQGRFTGLILIALPQNLPSEEVARLLTCLSNRGTITLEQINQDAQGFFGPFVYHNAFALADRQGRQKYCSVVVCNSPSAETLQAVSGFSFKLVDFKQLTASLLHTMFAHRLYDITPIGGALPVAEYLDVTEPAKGRTLYGVETLSIYADLFHKEFDSDAVSKAAVDAIYNAFGRAYSQTGKCNVLPREWQVALGAMRLARQMASWTLEGKQFECSVLLADGPAVKKIIDGEIGSFIRAFTLSSPVPFDFANKDMVRDTAESSQSDELFMLVDASDGQLKAIVVEQPYSGSQNWQNSRYARLRKLANEDRLLLHMRAGFVEVYADSSLLLWHDGFSWQLRPFDFLHREFLEHFKQQLRNEAPDAADALLNAVAQLLDRHQGSTIILLKNDNDTEVGFVRLAPTSLRPNLEDVGKEGVDFRKLSVGPLASILHVDGAHAITQNARLKYRARRISVNEDLYKLVDVSDKPRGTGTFAAQWLSLALKESVSIRVSSSGYVKVFKEGRSVYYRGRVDGSIESHS